MSAGPHTRRPSTALGTCHVALHCALVVVSALGAGCAANTHPQGGATATTDTAATTMLVTSTNPATPAATVTGTAATLPIGAVNPAVTQATIGTTICVRGWTATVRPPESYTSALKTRQLAAVGYADQNPADYEEDHIIPLELGGAPRDETNLRPEAWPAAHLKDKDENRLHSPVCAGTMTLDAARAEMAAYAAAESGLPAGAAPVTTSQSTATPATPPTGSTYYANCAAVRAAGKAPLHRGEPGYRSEMDGDGDGVACE